MMKAFVLLLLVCSANAVCDCQVTGCATKCKLLDPNSFCGQQGQPVQDDFTDGSGCACDWGLKYFANSTIGHFCGGSGPAPPAPISNCTRYIVQPGDTCDEIAFKFHTDLAHISVGHGMACPYEIYPGEYVTVCPENAPTDCKYHTVVAGETCTSIAAEFHTDVQHITTADGYLCPWEIFPGQDVLVCPDTN